MFSGKEDEWIWCGERWQPRFSCSGVPLQLCVFYHHGKNCSALMFLRVFTHKALLGKPKATLTGMRMLAHLPSTVSCLSVVFTLSRECDYHSHSAGGETKASRAFVPCPRLPSSVSQHQNKDIKGKCKPPCKVRGMTQ